MDLLIDIGPAVVVVLLVLLLADMAFNAGATAKGWRDAFSFIRPADGPNDKLPRSSSNFRRGSRFSRADRPSRRSPRLLRHGGLDARAGDSIPDVERRTSL